MRQCKYFNNLNAIRNLYYAYVRSKLEYASQVWNPCYTNLISEIAKIERKFLKFLYFKMKGRYPERGLCNDILLNLAAVEDITKRRVNRYLIFLKSLLNGKVDAPELNTYLVP